MDIELLLSHPDPSQGSPLTLRALTRIRGQTPREASRAPLNLAVVLDRSGSMSGAKLEQAREAAALLLRRLRQGDRVSVVTYDTDVQTLLAGGTGELHHAGAERLRRISAGSLTNLSGGWLRGRDLVRDGLSPDGMHRVLLLTDGLANQGITDPGALVGLCRSARTEGISTTTIGFGQDFDEDLLRAMADAGGGAAYYIENPDQAPGIFEEEMEGLLSLSAQNVTLDLSVESGVTLAGVRHSYPATQTDRGVRLDIGDLYAREPRLVLMEFLLKDAEPGARVNVATITVHGHVLTHDGGMEERQVTLPVRLDVGHGPRVEPEIRRIALLLDAADARDEALRFRERGEWEAARQILRSTAERIEREVPDDPEGARESEGLRALASRMSEQVFESRDVKYMKQELYDQRRSRSSAREAYRR